MQPSSAYLMFYAQIGEPEKLAGSAVTLTAQSGLLGSMRLADRPRLRSAYVVADAVRASPRDDSVGSRQCGKGRRVESAASASSAWVSSADKDSAIADHAAHDGVTK
jgi:hypothetical protein